MRVKKIYFLLVCALLMTFVIHPTRHVAYAIDSSAVGGLKTGSTYYLIHYNGEQKEFTINESIKLTLTGWTDESETSANGMIKINKDSLSQTKNIILNVKDEFLKVPVSDTENIYFHLKPSDSLKVEKGTIIAVNQNGSSIEKVETINENGIVVEDQGLYYYKMDANGNRVRITKEEYDSLNSGESLEQEGANLFKTQAVSESQKPSVSYVTHVQDVGWLPKRAKNGETSGTVGSGKQVEAIQVFLEDSPYPNSGISYKTHVQDFGWMEPKSNGETSGTTGKNKQVEAISISLTGEIANHYDIYYRVYAEKSGWLGWAKNGENAGTEGFVRQVEGIDIVLVEKGGPAPVSDTKPFLSKPTIVYQSHVQDYGWLNVASNGQMSGTMGKAKQMEAISINLKNTTTFPGGIIYSTHVQDLGWLTNVTGGNISGTVGQGKQMEAIKINLTGEIANYFDIYYRVHVEDIGWMDWAKNGQTAGTEGLVKQIEAIEVKLVEKGGNAPGSTSKPFLLKPTIVYQSHVQDYGWMKVASNGHTSGTTGQNKRMEAIAINLEGSSSIGGSITYSTYIQDMGWVSWVTNGQISGTVGLAKRMEAIKININGEVANYFDVYYRTHIQDYGWLGWAKNGMVSGSVGIGKKVEAIEIKLVPKGRGDAVNPNTAGIKSKTVFLDPGHGGTDPGAVYGGYQEKGINLSVARKVKSILESRGYTVYMSRETDVFIPLLERSQMANNVDPDIFVSIHTNSTGSGANSKNGIEAYYYQYDPAYPSKINELFHNDPQRIAKSIELAKTIQQTMVSYTGARNNGIAGQTFSVVRETEVPATLLEIGYINNDKERQKLINDGYQNTLARAIADGIEKYFAAN
ncbi:N-acetylmuramoyl-L-alanine amidase [Caldifermentibacillus hisashii]|uniref:N-acetylmuramoyl-L-alanine amidase n=1 Tax=Caldifermentibacillus hisashii TaxID=996558 RepID=UPI0031FBA4A0